MADEEATSLSSQNSNGSEQSQGDDDYDENAEEEEEELSEDESAASSDCRRSTTAANSEGGLLDDLSVAEQYSVAQLHPVEGKMLSLSSVAHSHRDMPLMDDSRRHEHADWLSRMSASVSRHSQVEGSRFSLLLHARLVIIATEVRATRLEVQPGQNLVSDQEAPPKGPELPRLVAIGLGTFFQALRSLCKERHELMVEVATSLCTMLEGLPKLSFAEKEGELLDNLQDVLGSFVEGDGARLERELSLKAHVMLAMLRGSVKGVLESVLLATRQPQLCLPVYQHLSLIEPDRRPRKALCPLTVPSVLLREGPRIQGERLEGAAAAAGYVAMANDGMFLYMHSASGLAKVSCGKPVPAREEERVTGAGHQQAGEGRAGAVVKAVRYRMGERGWLVCAGGQLFFRSSASGHVVYRLSCDTLEEEGQLALGDEQGGGAGPLASDGRLLYALTRQEHFAVRVIDPADEEAAGSIRLAGPACGLKGGGQQAEGEVLDCDVLACGQNRKGELGHSASKEQLSPALIAGTAKQRVLKVAAGNETSYFLTEEGKVLCCGLNGSGQLGRATRGGEHRAEIEVMEGLPRARIVEVCCFNGAEHVLLLTDEGRVYSCGCNAYGQLGIDNVRRSSLIVLVEPLRHVTVTAVACSYHHSIAVTDQGEAYAFGLNDHGQLGIGSSRHSSSPKAMMLPSGTKIASASCGQHHSVLLTVDGRVFSCGRNHSGQLGLGARASAELASRTSADTPQLVEGFGEKVVLVACGYTHTLALTKSGKVFSFGNNNQGQLGHGNVENLATPKLVEALAEHKCVKVSCGAHHSCVLTDAGRVLAFGSNCHGQLGQGDTLERASPVIVAGLDGKGIIDVACGFHHLVALTADTSEPALEEHNLQPGPEGALVCTNGVVLSVYQAPDAEAGPREARVCRTFSLETGMHVTDQPSALTCGHKALTLDLASNAYWALSAGGSVELYGNMGQEVPAQLRDCCAESRFPCVSEAFLALPEHLVSERSAVLDAPTAALVTLARIEVMSRETLDDALPARWRPWSVDVRPQTLQVMGAVLEHCQHTVSDVKAQHLAVLCLRLARVNVAELVRLASAADDGQAVVEACAEATAQLLGRVQALLKNEALGRTPVHYECCRVLIDGLLVFFPSGTERVELLLGLLRRLASDDPGAGERLLAQMLLEAIAQSREFAMSLVPSAEEEVPPGSEALELHCESLRQLLYLLVATLDDPAAGTGPISQLVAPVTMMLLRAVVGEAVEDESGVVFSWCLQLFLVHLLTKATETIKRSSAQLSELSGRFFCSSLLPWAVTAAFIFVADLKFARSIMTTAVDLAEAVAGFGAEVCEEGEGDGAGEALVESMHPYEPSEREVYHVSLPGAAFLTVEFDSSCDLASGDAVQVFADSLCRQPVSAPLSAAGADFRTPILVVMGDSCCISFESAPSSPGGRWGFRCSVKGHAKPTTQPSWATFVRKSALELAGHCAASMFQAGAEWRPRRQGGDDVKQAGVDPVVLREGLDADATAAMDSAGNAGDAKVMAELSLLLSSRSPLLHGLIKHDEEKGTEKELLDQLSEGGGEQAGGVAGVRQRCFWQARKAALAAMMAKAGYVDTASVPTEEGQQMWAATSEVERSVAYAQQVLKARLREESEESRDEADEELSRTCFEAVLVEVRDKALLLAFANPEGAHAPLLPSEAAKTVLQYLKNTVPARQSINDMCWRRAMVAGRAAALRGMMRVLESSGADDSVKGDVLKLLSGHVERSRLTRPSMCDPRHFASLCAAYCALVTACTRLTLDSEKGSSLSKAFLSLLPLLPVEHAPADMGRVVDCVWSMCGAEPDSPQPHTPPVKVGDEYTLRREGPMEVRTHQLSGKHWSRVKVVQVQADGRVAVESQTEAGDSESVVVEREELDPPCVAARDVSAGERVFLPLAECSSPSWSAEGAGPVLVCGSLLSVEEGQAEVLVEGVEGADKVRVAAGALLRMQRAAGGPSVTVSRDLCARAEVSASSSNSMVDKVLDGRLDTYWQSSGSRPHWIGFVLPKAARLQGVLVYINYAKDRSFTPKRVTVKLGPSPDAKDLRQLCEVQIRQGADGWTNVLHPSAAGQVGQCVRLTICENQDSGCNSRVRSVKLVAAWAHGESDDTLARRGGKLLADAAQAALRLLTASVILSSRRAESEQALDTLERACLDHVWASLEASLHGGDHSARSSLCAEWVSFLVSASRTRAIRVYLEDPSTHRLLVRLLRAGDAAVQTQLLALYAQVLPALQRCPHDAILSPVLEIAGRALLLAPAPDDSQAVHWSVGVQCVYLLRSLLASPSWARSVEAVVVSALSAATQLDAIAEHSLKLVAALAVLGGVVDGLRVGCRVARVLDDGTEVVYGEVVTFELDCAMVDVKTETGGDAEVQRVHISALRVIDAVQYRPNPNLLPCLRDVFRVVHKGEPSELAAQQEGLSEGLVVQLRCLVVRALARLASSREAAEACFKGGLLHELLASAEEVGLEEGEGGVQLEQVYGAVLERMAQGGGDGEEGAGEVKESAVEVEPASPGEATRQEEARARDAQRQAVAADLMALGYSQRLCTVALQLNGDDPQAAATWLLDSSAQYLDNHPELLEDPDPAPASPADADAAQAEDTLINQSYFAPRSIDERGGLERSVSFPLRAEEVKPGMMVQVVGSSATIRGIEGMFGRCGSVAMVDRETGTASVRWGAQSNRGRALVAVPISALGRPDAVSALTLCMPLSLQGATALLGAAKALLSRMHALALADALARTVAHGASLASLVAVPTVSSPAQTSAKPEPGCGQPPSEAQVSRLLLTAASVSRRLREEEREELHGGLSALLGVWQRGSRPSDENDANIDAGAQVRKRVVDECQDQLARSAPADWVMVDESPHPLGAPLDGTPRPVRVSGRAEQAVSVLFDVKSHLANSQRLQLFLDEACTELVASCSGKGSAVWVPLLLPRNTLRVRVTGSSGQGVETVWGYRLAVTPVSVPAVQLTSWATLSYLDCAALSAGQLAGLLHRITDAVAQLSLPCPLRTSLTRALVGLMRRAASGGAGSGREADVQAAMARVQGMAAAELRARCDKEGGQGVSVAVQGMAELLSACAQLQSDAAQPAADRAEGLAAAGGEEEAEEAVEGAGELRALVGERELPCREVALRLPAAGGLAAEEAVTVASVLAEALVECRPVGGRCDALLCQAFLADHSPYQERESAQHPYRRGTEERGVVLMEGAVRLRVVLDKRCASDGDDYLTFFASDDETAKVASYSGTFGTSGHGADTRLVVEGDRLSYTFIGKKASNWGYRFLVRAEYGAGRQLATLRKNRGAVEDAVAGMRLCTPNTDAALVALLNHHCEVGGLSSLACHTDMALPKQDLPAPLAALPRPLLRFRLAVLQAFNELLASQVLPMLDFTLRGLKGSILHAVTSQRHLLFLDVKTSFMHAALAARLDKADKAVVLVDRRSSKTVLEQLLVQVGRMAARRLWHPDMAFLVQFLGEGAEGYNGPYRECLSSAAADLHAPALRMLVPSPNQEAGGTAPHQHCAVPRPSSVSPHLLGLWELLGRLLGVAVWTRLPLDLHLPPMLWRRLVGQGPAPSDLSEVDAHAHRLLRAMLRDDADLPPDALPDTFELLLSDGTRAELCLGGAQRAVTADNQQEYAELALSARLKEAVPQLQAMRKGLEEMLPGGLVELLEGAELERLAAGSAAVDVELLRQHTVCRGEDGHQHVVDALWRVLGSMSQDDLAAFLRFVWGRSRLPRPSEFTETFKIHISSSLTQDNKLPKADTCFFTLNLPAYSSEEVLRARLLYAIRHCTDMDADLLEAAIPHAAR